MLNWFILVYKIYANKIRHHYISLRDNDDKQCLPGSSTASSQKLSSNKFYFYNKFPAEWLPKNWNHGKAIILFKII